MAALLASDLLMGGVPLSALFRFDAGTKMWLTNRPGRPVFLSTFTTVDRLTGLFVLNDTGASLTWSWDQVGGSP